MVQSNTEGIGSEAIGRRGGGGVFQVWEGGMLQD